MGILKHKDQKEVTDFPSTHEVRARLVEAETQVNDLKRFARERQALRRALKFYSNKSDDGQYARSVLRQWPDESDL